MSFRCRKPRKRSRFRPVSSAAKFCFTRTVTETHGGNPNERRGKRRCRTCRGVAPQAGGRSIRSQHPVARRGYTVGGYPWSVGNDDCFCLWRPVSGSRSTRGPGNEAAGKPWFAWFNSSRMHVWTNLKPESDGVTGKGIYADGMVEHDGDVGTLLDLLDELKIADNTIVIYTTDNGPHYNT
ncbi:MAG: sulfatase-like hydrolase/transferase, partial [Thiogranum sp.]